MANNWFQFKQFRIVQDQASFKVGTDGCLLGAWAELNDVQHILDVGTGSGLIALMLAQRTRATITAIDIDPENAIQASENFQQSLWSDRLRAVHVSLQEFVRVSEIKFDHVVCNPPFFKGSTHNPKERKTNSRHENTLRIDELLNLSFDITDTTGRLSLVLPYDRWQEMQRVTDKVGWNFERITRVKPKEGKAVNRMLVTLSKEQIDQIAEDELTIYSSHGEYSESVLHLLRPYYLHL